MTFWFHSNNRSQFGFTLISVILILLVMAVGAASVTLLISPGLVSRQARETTEKAVLLQDAIDEYADHHLGAPPPSLDDLVNDDGSGCVPDQDPGNGIYFAGLKGWCGPYLHPVFLEDALGFKSDAWGVAFQYESGTGAFYSCGPDQVCQTGDDLTYE